MTPTIMLIISIINQWCKICSPHLTHHLMRERWASAMPRPTVIVWSKPRGPTRNTESRDSNSHNLPVSEWTATTELISVLCHTHLILWLQMKAKHCVPRLEKLWHDELKQRGREGASLTRVFWRFCQTRMLVAIFSLLLTMVAGFVGPVSVAPAAPLVHRRSSSPCRLISFNLSCRHGSSDSACYFIPFHAGLRNWNPPPCCEIMKLLTVRPILMS